MTHAHAPSSASWLQLHRAAVAMALVVAVILGAWAAATALRSAPTTAGAAAGSSAEQVTRDYVKSTGLVTPAERATRAYQRGH